MFPGLSSMPNAPITATAQQPVASSRAEIEAFLGQVKALDPSIAASERGHIIFALDATMSRQPTSGVPNNTALIFSELMDTKSLFLTNNANSWCRRAMRQGPDAGPGLGRR